MTRSIAALLILPACRAASAPAPVVPMSPVIAAPATAVATTPPPASAAPPAPHDWCEAIYGAPKLKLDAFCSVGERETPEFAELSAIVNARVEACHKRGLHPPAFDAAQSCQREIEAAGWKDELAADEPGVLFGACRDIDRGSVPAGKECGADNRCAAGLWCQGDARGKPNAFELRFALGPAPWGGGSVFGNMWGESSGDSFGAGGLGLSGVGAGSGGAGIGLDNFRGLGHGAGTGSGSGRGNHRAKVPQVSFGATTVRGRLPPEVIQRIVRRHSNRFRFCYQNGLTKNPAAAPQKLHGTIQVEFQIAADGSVTHAAIARDGLGDAQVASCVLRAFGAMSFPRPEGGVVRVRYPLHFSTADDTARTARPAPIPGGVLPPIRGGKAPEKIARLAAPSSDKNAIFGMIGLISVPAPRCHAIDTASAALGESCSADRPCVAGEYCDDKGKCEARKHAGGACSSHFECRGLCRAGKCEPFCGSD